LSHKHSTKTTTAALASPARHKHTKDQTNTFKKHCLLQLHSRPDNRRIVRCSRPLFNNQTPHPPTPPAQHRAATFSEGGPEAPRPHGVIPQDPTVCQTPTPATPARFHTPTTQAGVVLRPTPKQAPERSSTIPLASSTTADGTVAALTHGH